MEPIKGGISMNEAEAYSWAAQATRCVDNLIEPHKGQQLADAVASAIIEAYREGYLDGIAAATPLECKK